jgi:hypothetical protein
MILNDIFYFIALNYFFIIWLMPVAWMALFSVKTNKLNNIFCSIYKYSLVFSLFIFVGLMEHVVSTFDFIYNSNPTTFLMIFYFSLAVTFTYYLIVTKNWNLPQAISIGIICAFIGSYYWETPFLLYNAYTRGFEPEWVLHIMGLMFVWFVHKSVGWKKDIATLFIVSGGFVLAGIFMRFGEIPSPLGIEQYRVWNSAYYMTIRLICTLISFYAVNKSIPKEVKK